MFFSVYNYFSLLSLGCSKNPALPLSLLWYHPCRDWLKSFLTAESCTWHVVSTGPTGEASYVYKGGSPGSLLSPPWHLAGSSGCHWVAWWWWWDVLGAWLASSSYCVKVSKCHASFSCSFDYRQQTSNVNFVLYQLVSGLLASSATSLDT